MTYTPARRAELSFGDVCGGEFLYDVHAREDARAMGADSAGASFARKTYGVDGELTFFLPGINIKADANYVLAHGVHQQALVLSDDCLIETALGRGTGGPTNRRLLFAPIAEATTDDIAELAGSNFGRFPLPADEHFDEHRVIDLRRCFMVDARDIAGALDGGGFRIASLDDEARAQLAVRWSAYTLRRGPFVAEDSLEKFAEYLLDSGRVTNETAAVSAAEALANVVAAAWGFEGRGVDGAGTAADDERDPQEVIDSLLTELESLRSTLGAALDAVTML